jgi:protein SCO1
MKLLPLLLSATVLYSSALAESPCCKTVERSLAYTDQSLYQLESTWTSDMGKLVKLGALRGRPQVVSMFFAQCEYACPILTYHMKHLEGALPKALCGKVDFLLVTFDTERDTPEALRAYRQRQKLGEANWTLLRGNSEDVRELAVLLGVNYAKGTRGQFAHSNVITLLDAEGEIAYQHTGLSSGTEALIKKLQEMMPESLK